MFERIETFKGYFLAVYACPVGQLGHSYLGHFSIFSEQPKHFWSKGTLCTRNTGELLDCAESAMDQAALLGRLAILNLVPLSRVAAPGEPAHLGRGLAKA